MPASTASPNGASSPARRFFSTSFCAASPSLILYFLKIASTSVSSMARLPLGTTGALLLLLLLTLPSYTLLLLLLLLCSFLATPNPLPLPDSPFFAHNLTFPFLIVPRPAKPSVIVVEERSKTTISAKSAISDEALLFIA